MGSFPRLYKQQISDFCPGASLAGAQTQCNSVSCCLIARLTQAGGRDTPGGKAPGLLPPRHLAPVRCVLFPLFNSNMLYVLSCPKCKNIILSGIQTFLFQSNFSILLIFSHMFTSTFPSSSPPPNPHPEQAMQGGQLP